MLVPYTCDRERGHGMSIIISYGLHGNDDATNGLISCVGQKTPHVRSRGNFIAPITGMICCSTTRTSRRSGRRKLTLRCFKLETQPYDYRNGGFQLYE